MSLRNSISRSLQCPNFRTQLLNSFISLTAPNTRLPASWPRSTRHIQKASYSTTLARADRETLSRSADHDDAHSSETLQSEPLEHSLIEEDSSLQEEDSSLHEEDLTLLEQDLLQHEEEAELHEEASTPHEEESLDASLEANSSATNVPWYLQVDPPIAQQSHPLSERQRLPSLPEYSPEILLPILEHLSIELGMDDLSLLDLRALDPPPALGANLLMVIGTARSEKHLHVSADRLCRWLRSTHRLTPFADGLLGRNELKLKLRRKAKRSKMLGAVGAKESSSDLDDGIRTGWVCVNVGRVEGGILPEQQEKQARKIENFVGFGTQTSTCNIVVQIMTDEKRGEMDLETLWQGILRRSLKAQQEQDSKDEKTEKSDQEVPATHDEDISTKPYQNIEVVDKPDQGAVPYHGVTELYHPVQSQSMRQRPRHARAYHASAILQQLPDTSAFGS